MAEGRNWMKSDFDDEDFVSDQLLQKPQPPLVKAAMRGEEARIALPCAFAELPYRRDFFDILRDRHSARVYTQEPLTLLQLSFLLWATQGVKGDPRQVVCDAAHGAVRWRAARV